MKFVRVLVVMILPPSLETLSNCRFIVGVESQIPLSTSSIFFEWARILRILKSPSVCDVSTGKLSSGAEVFSDTAQTLGSLARMKCGLS